MSTSSASLVFTLNTTVKVGFPSSPRRQQGSLALLGMASWRHPEITVALLTVALHSLFSHHERLTAHCRLHDCCSQSAREHHTVRGSTPGEAISWWLHHHARTWGAPSLTNTASDTSVPIRVPLPSALGTFCSWIEHKNGWLSGLPFRCTAPRPA